MPAYAAIRPAARCPPRGESLTCYDHRAFSEDPGLSKFCCVASRAQPATCPRAAVADSVDPCLTACGKEVQQ
jgi:hypothetical protein